MAESKNCSFIPLFLSLSSKEKKEESAFLHVYMFTSLEKRKKEIMERKKERRKREEKEL